MLNQLFAQTQDRYGIKGKNLSEITGVSQNHISEFRRGRTDVSSSVLWKLVQAMDELAPGAKSYFCSLLNEKKASVGDALQQLIEAADDEEIEQAMLAIARRYRALSKSTDARTTALRV